MTQNPLNKSLPTKFFVTIGGFMGESFQCELVDNQFIYRAFGRSYSDTNQFALNVSDEDWQTFMTVIVQLGVHEWEETMTSEIQLTDGSFFALSTEVMDGTSWSVEIKTDKYHMYSHASNAYPTNFEKFLEAMQILLKGEKFY